MVIYMKLVKLVFNIFIFLVLQLLIMVAMFVQCSKTLISQENISDFISDADILNVDINVLFNQEESGITLKEKIAELATLNNIPDEIVEDILQSEEINQLLGDFFNQTITYIIEGGKKPQISETSIENMKKAANTSLNNHLNIMLEEEQLEIYIEDYSKSITNIVPDRTVVIGDMPTDIIKYIINFDMTYLYIAIILLLALPALSTKKFYTPIKYLGFAMFISGIIFVIIGSMEFVITSFIANNIQGMVPFVLSLITNVLTIWFKSGVLISFTSILLLLIYTTLNRIYNK